MTAAQVGTLCILLAGAVTVTTLVVAGGAALARLWFLARIEAIRDDVVTAILDGTLDQNPEVNAWLAELDGIVRPARHLPNPTTKKGRTCSPNPNSNQAR